MFNHDSSSQRLVEGPNHHGSLIVEATAIPASGGCTIQNWSYQDIQWHTDVSVKMRVTIQFWRSTVSHGPIWELNRKRMIWKIDLAGPNVSTEFDQQIICQARSEPNLGSHCLALAARPAPSCSTCLVACRRQLQRATMSCWSLCASPLVHQRYPDSRVRMFSCFPCHPFGSHNRKQRIWDPKESVI